MNPRGEALLRPDNGWIVFTSFIGGAIVGYAIAIPVGAIALLILQAALRRGFRSGFAAASGAATADLIYATVAATLGTVLAGALGAVAGALKYVSALVLVALGAWGLWNLWHAPGAESETATEPPRTSFVQTYASLLSLTLLNPATVAYFAALILGLSVRAQPALADKIAFVLGAFLASWSWQTLLAAVGALAHKHLPGRFRRTTSFIGNLVIILLGIKILI